MFGQNNNPAMKKLLILKDQISYFDGLSNSEIEDLVENIKIIQYSKGTCLVSEGSGLNNDMFFLLNGSVDIVKTNNDKEIKLASMDNPGVFGEMGALTREPRSTSIIAGRKGALVLAFSLKNTEDRGKTLFYKNIINELSKKIVDMNQKTTT